MPMTGSAQLRFRRLCMSALAAAGLRASAQEVEDPADAEIGGAYVGLQASTLGVGPALGYYFSEQLGIRGQFNWLDYETDGVGEDYSGNLEFRSGGLLLDCTRLAAPFE